jgi:hypothetical protein
MDRRPPSTWVRTSLLSLAFAGFATAGVAVYLSYTGHPVIRQLSSWFHNAASKPLLLKRK